MEKLFIFVVVVFTAPDQPFILGPPHRTEDECLTARIPMPPPDVSFLGVCLTVDEAYKRFPELSWP